MRPAVGSESAGASSVSSAQAQSSGIAKRRLKSPATTKGSARIATRRHPVGDRLHLLPQRRATCAVGRIVVLRGAEAAGLEMHREHTERPAPARHRNVRSPAPEAAAGRERGDIGIARVLEPRAHRRCRWPDAPGALQGVRSTKVHSQSSGARRPPRSSARSRRRAPPRRRSSTSWKATTSTPSASMRSASAA